MGVVAAQEHDDSASHLLSLFSLILWWVSVISIWNIEYFVNNSLWKIWTAISTFKFGTIWPENGRITQQLETDFWSVNESTIATLGFHIQSKRALSHCFAGLRIFVPLSLERATNSDAEFSTNWLVQFFSQSYHRHKRIEAHRYLLY